MIHELTPASHFADPTLIDQLVVDPEVYSLALEGVKVAEAISQSEPFNYACADFSLRNTAALFNGADSIDGVTLSKLEAIDTQRLTDLAVRTIEFLGEKGEQDVRASLNMYAPRSAEEATVLMMQQGFNAFQVAVSSGPDHGYDRSQEPVLRELVISHAKTFASLYCGLSGLGHSIATDSNLRRYFTSNINAAKPIGYREAESLPDAINPSLDPNPLESIAPIELSAGQEIRSADDLIKFVEKPALPACQDLFHKNIKTISASANRKNGDEAYVIVDFASLSDANKAIAFELGEPISAIRDGKMGDPSTPESVKVAVPVEPSDTPESLSSKLALKVEPFMKQRLLWAETYSLEELKKVYGFAEDDGVGIKDFTDLGFYYDPETERIHLSEEMYRKSLSFPDENEVAK